MAEFIFADRNKTRCAITVDSSLATDQSTAELLRAGIESISGAEADVGPAGSAAGEELNKVLVGTLSESPRILELLERESIALGLDTPEAENFAKGDIGEPAETIKSCALRRSYICADTLDEQSFVVFMAADGSLILSGGGPAGTLYAIQTVINHMFIDDDMLKVDDLHTEKLPIFSTPAIQRRGICTNIGGPDHLSHNQWETEWVKDGEYDYKAFVDWLVQFKFNHMDIWLFEIGFGISYPSKKFPECVNQHHPNVKNEFAGDMIEYAHQRGVTVSVFIDFPDMFSGIMRHHPELGMKQFDASQLPCDEDWEEFQKTGKNPNKHDFRGKLGTVCASRPEVMQFWEAYLEELFERYPEIDGITGQFAEALGICECDNCRKDFFELQWKFFKRMGEIAQKDRPDRLVINCMSPGDVGILKHRNELNNFINLDWGGNIQLYQYNRSSIQGEWYLFHHSGSQWCEYAKKNCCNYMSRIGVQGALMRSVIYQERESAHFSYGEFTWNPETTIEHLAELYTKKSLRRKDDETIALYTHWMKARGYAQAMGQLASWKEKNMPYSAKAIDEEYPRLLKEEMVAISSLLGKAESKNALYDMIAGAFQEQEDELAKLV